MKTYITILSFLFYLGITAQTTSIPDSVFEQYLIDEGIDSDGVINGQVLTSDIDTVTVLTLEYVEDLTGLEDFAALESLVIEEGGDDDWVFPPDAIIDLTANTNLISIEIWSYKNLKTLDVTGLDNLENLTVAELQDDVLYMFIEEIDLSTNPNIKFVETGFLDTLKEINLQNGNNINTTDMLINIMHYDNSLLCIKVDNADAATNNSSPYDSWTMYGVDPIYYDSGNCTLGIDSVKKIELALYPNPVQNSFQIQTSVEIQSVQIFSITGKAIASFGAQQNYDIAGLSAGVYFVKVQSENGERIQRIIKQ